MLLVMITDMSGSGRSGISCDKNGSRGVGEVSSEDLSERLLDKKYVYCSLYPI